MSDSNLGLTKEEWEQELLPKNKKISQSIQAGWDALSEKERDERIKKASYGKLHPIYLRKDKPKENYEGNLDYVKCEICGEYLRMIHILHLRVHGVTLEEYSHLFPGKPTYSESLRDQQSYSHLGLTKGASTGELISENNRKFWANPVNYLTRCLALRESMKAPEFRKKRSEISKALWKDPKYVKKVMEGKAKTIRHIQNPNLEETLFWIWVNSFRPKSITHNKKPILEARLTPDFLVNGQKKVIEYFGVYWHDPSQGAPGRDRPTEEEVIERYAKAGYKCLIVWSDEVFLDETRKKIEEFIDD